MIALSDATLAARLKQERADNAKAILAKNAALQEQLQAK
jgi:hypothetical protein